ncbi:MAG: hypothetical protein JHC61_10555 [Burkholderiaceae bacterium]|nr:hypothetical protein [Burkholderiaceae bacterium]
MKKTPMKSFIASLCVAGMLATATSAFAMTPHDITVSEAPQAASKFENQDIESGVLAVLLYWTWCMMKSNQKGCP